MDDGDRIQEWVSLKHSPKMTTVTVSLVQGTRSVRWTVKTFMPNIREGIIEARTRAHEGLSTLTKTLAELDGEA